MPGIRISLITPAKSSPIVCARSSACWLLPVPSSLTTISMQRRVTRGAYRSASSWFSMTARAAIVTIPAFRFCAVRKRRDRIPGVEPEIGQHLLWLALRLDLR